jgi:hypothetical protein
VSTPLFDKVAREAARGSVRARKLLAPPLAAGLQFFEISAIEHPGIAPAGALPNGSAASAREVWPAEAVWIERRWSEVGRFALLLTARAYPMIDLVAITLRPLSVGIVIEVALEDTPAASREAVLERQGVRPSVADELKAMLAWISSPLPRRRAHRPLFGLETKLRRAGMLPDGVRLMPSIEILPPSAAAARREAA